MSFARLLRLLKLSKILRMVRFLTFFKALQDYMVSFERSVVSLFWAFVLMFFAVYIFGLTFSSAALGHLLEDPDTSDRSRILDKYGSSYQTMLTLYMCVTGGADWGDAFEIVLLCGEVYGVLFIFFTFLFGFAIFNIITAIIVEKAVQTLAPDVEEELEEYHQK